LAGNEKLKINLNMKRNIAFVYAFISCLFSFSQNIDNQALDWDNFSFGIL
jgi:hypothetical protein